MVVLFLGTIFCKLFRTKRKVVKLAYEKSKKNIILMLLIVIGGDGSLRGAEEFERETGFSVNWYSSYY